jgi:hypothetical protein
MEKNYNSDLVSLNRGLSEAEAEARTSENL